MVVKGDNFLVELIPVLNFKGKSQKKRLQDRDIPGKI